MVATLLIFVSMLVDVFSTNQNNSFTCFENGCICIPQSYDNLKGPSDNGTMNGQALTERFEMTDRALQEMPTWPNVISTK